MYRRILFIGLGGSGGKTLRYVIQDLRGWLNQIGWPSDQPMPQGFQFLHIDTPTVEDGREIKIDNSLDENEYVGLIGANVTLTSVVHGVDNSPDYIDTAGWRVDPSAINVTIAEGAGQYRAVGRTIAVSQVQHLKQGLDNALARIESTEALNDSGTLWDLAGNAGTQEAPQQPLVFVISSIAGGTGAGLLIDVCDMLRVSEPAWGGSSIGILYTPEVFSNINKAFLGGVHANSLAAFTELLNGYYLKGSAEGAAGYVGDGVVSTRTNRFLSTAGLPGGVQQSGPMYPILVGKSNAAGMQFDRDTQVFSAMGSVLSLICRDKEVQKRIQKMTYENWDNMANSNIGHADLLVTRGPLRERGKAVFQALGCAKVSVGTMYMRRYAAARLANEAYRWITRYHVEEADGRALEASGIKDPRDKARVIAQKHIGWFLKIACLDERGQEKNDITDFLTPVEFLGEISQAYEDVKRLIGSDQSMNAKAWLEQIYQHVPLVSEGLRSKMMPLVERQVAEWVKIRPDTLIKATEESIASYGLLVTAEILRLVKTDLIDPATGVEAELMGPTERGHYRGQSEDAQWQAAAQAELTGIKGKFKLNDNESITTAIEAAVDGASHLTDVRIREIAALMVREFADSVLEPMIVALSQAFEEVSDQKKDTDTWPDWTYENDSPSEEFLPFKNELTLIEPQRFSNEFVKQLALSMNGTVAEREDHRATARADVISGAFIRELAEEQNQVSLAVAIIKRAKWSPTYNLIRESNQSHFEVEVRMGPESLRQRAELWLNRPGSTLQGFLTQGLGTYTSNTGINKNLPLDEVKQRQSEFMAKLRTVIQLSAPLVEINTSLQEILNIPKGGESSFSEMPFAAPHPLAEAVSNVLEKHFPQNLIPVGLMSSKEIQTVEVISALLGPQMPVLISSLLMPIGAKWSEVRNSANKKTSFWSYRRARLTPESIPAPQAHITAMVRGWFTAFAFGLLDIPSNRGGAIRIAHYSDKLEPARFPETLLSGAFDVIEDGRTERSLFAVLESLGLAMVEVCEKKNTSPLNAYIALRDFGLSEPADQDVPILSYELPNPLVRDWIATGEIRTPKRQIELSKGLVSTIRPKLANVTTAEERGAALKQHFSGQLNYLLEQETTFLDLVKTDRNQLNDTMKWQTLFISPDGPSHFILAMSALIKAVDNWQNRPIS